jgi:hypothetical protein
MRIWIFLALTLTACQADHQVFSVNPDQGALDKTTFAEIRMEILDPHCVRCHKDYTNIEVVRAGLQTILSEVENGKMPPRQPLAQNLVDRLKIWAESGAPD